MKNAAWLKETEKLLQDIPKQMLKAWEEKNPGRSITETWGLIKKWNKIGNYALLGASVSVCLSIILAWLEHLNPDGPLGTWLTITSSFWVLMVVADFRLIGPETRINQLKRSVATLEKCGLVPRNGLWQNGRDEIAGSSRVRLTENALIVLYMEDNLKSLKSSVAPVEEVAMAAESVLVFKNQFDRALKAAVEFDLSLGLMGTYFHEAEKRKKLG